VGHVQQSTCLVPNQGLAGLLWSPLKASVESLQD